MDFNSLFTGMNLVLAGAIFGIVAAIKQVPGITSTHWGQRLMPLFPLLLGAVGGLVGAVVVDPVTIANKIVAGLMVGGLSMIVFKVTNTTIFGKGVGSPASKEAVEPPKEE